MALIADDARDRAEQLLLLTERLTALIGEETRRVEARQPPLDGAEGEEKNRLANAYRLELARIKQDRSLLDGAPDAVLAQLKQRTTILHEALAAHDVALGAMKLVTEGLVQAMAEETARHRNGGGAYGKRGAVDRPRSPGPTIIDRSA